MLSILIGTTQAISATFEQIDGATYDPSALTLTVQSPSGVATVRTYGVDAITRDAAGSYYSDFTFTEVGVWSWSWHVNDTAKLKSEGQVFVRPSVIT